MWTTNSVRYHVPDERSTSSQYIKWITQEFDLLGVYHTGSCSEVLYGAIFECEYLWNMQWSCHDVLVSRAASIYQPWPQHKHKRENKKILSRNSDLETSKMPSDCTVVYVCVRIHGCATLERSSRRRWVSPPCSQVLFSPGSSSVWSSTCIAENFHAE